MATLDLDAERAARAETPGGHTLRVGGREFALPAELPHGFGQACIEAPAKGEEGVARALRLLFGGQYDDLVDQRLTDPDIADLFNKLPALYGLDGLGESSASNGSSPSTGSRSRPTSKRTTASTSGKRAGAKRR